MSDNQLIQGLREGSSESFRLLVDQNQRKVINICYRITGNDADAEDLAQDVFVEVLRSIGKFRGDSSLATWIHRIAVRKSLDFRRDQVRQKRGGPLKRLFRLDDPGVDLPAPSDHQPDVELELKERQAILRSALDTLPENQRAAFLISKYDGLSNREVADALKLTVPAVESLVHRAKLNLRKKLRQLFERGG